MFLFILYSDMDFLLYLCGINRNFNAENQYCGYQIIK